MFKYDIVHQSRTTVILDGDMDIDVTEIIQEEIAPQLLDRKEIELNFAKVCFVDSSGIGLLITLIHELKERGNRVVFTHLQPDVKQVFVLLQLPEILGNDVFEDFSKDGEV